MLKPDMTYRSSEKNYREKPVITSVVIPVEVFIIFQIYNDEKFTVNDLIRRFQNLHDITLNFDRMQKIANDLVSAKKVRKRQDINKKNKLVNYYSFQTLVA